VSATAAPARARPAPQAVMARAGGENFPVASRLLPRAQRRHLLAIYGYARLVDELGDSAPGNRLSALDQLEAEVEALSAGRVPADPLLAALQRTVAACRLPTEPLRALIEANRRDQLVHRYRTYEELLGYCALSAEPVGELVLHVFGAATPQRLELSGRICSALQLAEHWQDVAEDYRAGRIYLPGEDLERFGVAEEELGASIASPRLRALIAFEVTRARRLLDEGTPLVWTLRGRARLAVAAFVAGGRTALEAVSRAGAELLAGPPRARRAELVAETLRLLARRSVR
jgi:squalene synthase HpnC